MTLISNFAIEVNFLLHRSLYIKLMTRVRTSFYDNVLTSYYSNVARQNRNVEICSKICTFFLPVYHQLKACYSNKP